MIALDWERLIPGHPHAGGRLGTKDDVRNHLAYMEELSAEVKKAQAEGKCTQADIGGIKLPKYAAWGDYERYLAGNVERYCTYHATGK